MNREKLSAIIRERKSLLCVGLDIDLKLIPEGVSPIEFNKSIIDATRDLAVAYKPNLAFYECLGIKGWELFQETVEYIGSEHFIIADAKRGDIGNTSKYYAQTFFETYSCDAVTIAPYMGEDSVTPFLGFKDKWAIVLGLTSNKGANDFQTLSLGNEKVYERVLKSVVSWGNDENIMFVIGATQASALQEIRKIIPNHFLLVPGVGAQGGSLDEVLRNGMTVEGGLLINASRSILYASKESDFAAAARAEALKMQSTMAAYF